MEEIVAHSLSAFTCTSPGNYQIQLCLGPQSPIFKGHFPARPIVPGIILLEAARQAAEMACGQELALAEVKQVKFKDLVLPAQNVQISFSLIQEGSNFRISAKFNSSESLKANMILALTPRH